jgi:hypothetical protein
MPAIYWTAFTWEAFATLASGLAAVAAAFTVGRRQVAIADRQSKILDRQVALDEMTLRSELFDRRFAIYERTRALLSAVLVHDAPAEDPVVRAFQVALNQSTFLFRPSVCAHLGVIWDRYCKYGAVKGMMDDNFRRTGQYGNELIEVHTAHLLYFNETLQDLSEALGDEMRLWQV